MLEIALSLLPVFALILLGAGLKQAGFPGDALWPHLERLTYFVLFPPLLFHTIVVARLGAEAWALAGALATGIALMTVTLLVLRPVLPISGPAYSSVFQGAIRWNGFVAVGVVNALSGAPGVALAAVAFATMVPLVNMLSVVILAHHAGDGPAEARSVLKLVFTNPLILACLAGLAVMGAGITLPAPLLQGLKMLADATIALGLLAVGAALHARQLKAMILPGAVTTALKLGIMPLFMLAGCMAFGVTGLGRTVAIICASVPGATSSYILARQLGGDAALMANLITLTTLFSVVTMPLMIHWLGA